MHDLHCYQADAQGTDYATPLQPAGLMRITSLLTMFGSKHILHNLRRILLRCRTWRDQQRMTVSLEDDATMLLFALTARSVISPSCPRQDASSSALSTLQICSAGLHLDWPGIKHVKYAFVCRKTHLCRKLP